MITNGISKTEKIWVTYQTDDGDTYYITSNRDRSMYFLYKRDEDKVVKLGKSKNPKSLEETIEH